MMLTASQKRKEDITVEDIADAVSARARVSIHPIFGIIVNENGNKQINPRAHGFATQVKTQPFKAFNKDQSVLYATATTGYHVA